MGKRGISLLTSHRLRLAHLLNRVLRPLVVHSGTPCTAFSILGKRNPQQADWDLLQFTIDVAIHLSFQGLLMSVENPTSSALWAQPRWLEHFGSRTQPMLPWRFFASDGCQHGQISQGIHEDGQPFLRGQTWMANYSLADLELRCKQPFSVAARQLPHAPSHFGIRAHCNWFRLHRRV